MGLHAWDSPHGDHEELGVHDDAVDVGQAGILKHQAQRRSLHLAVDQDQSDVKVGFGTESGDSTRDAWANNATAVGRIKGALD